MVKNGNKGTGTTPKRLDLLHILQRLMNSTAVTTVLRITPGDDRSISNNSGESARSGLDLLHIL